jgi:FKBP-type peptidyl-prolyl cis-trans isomerase SlpA
MQQAGEAAEAPQHSSAIWNTPGLRAGAQQQGQQLGVAQRRGAARQQLFARAARPKAGLSTPRKCPPARPFYNGPSLSGLAWPPPRPGSNRAPSSRCTTGWPDPAGDIINTFADKPATLTLGTGELSPAVEQRLLGLEEGTRTQFEIPAGEAFGDRNPEMVQWVARKLLVQLGDPDESYAVGDVVQFPTPDGMGQYAGAVQQLGEDRDGDGRPDAVLFDFNHPLAGQPVTFEVHLIGVL